MATSWKHTWSDMTSAFFHNAHIAVVDDDSLILEIISLTLINNDYRVSPCINALEFWQLWKKNPPDMIILDLNLPDGDGMEICRMIRTRSSVPILMLTSRADEIERVLGLEMGADDYLIKPFFPRELLARIKTILRRAKHTLNVTASPTETPRYYHFSNWSLNPSTRQLIAPDGTEADLTEGETRLLILFLTHPHQILSREQISQIDTRLTDNPSNRGIDNMVSRLRKRLHETSWKEGIIQTVRNEGYRLQSDVERSSRMDSREDITPRIPIHALLMSNNPTLALILDVFLHHFDITLHLRPIGQQTLETDQSHPTAMLFLDCTEPDQEWHSVIQTIRATMDHPLLLIVPGPDHHQNSQPANTLTNLADGVLTTPLRFLSLQTLLNRLLPSLNHPVSHPIESMDKILLTELTHLGGQPGFLRFLHLLTSQLTTSCQTLQQAASTLDHATLIKETQWLHNLAQTIGAMEIHTATTTLLHHLTGKTENAQMLSLDAVESACTRLHHDLKTTRQMTPGNTL